MEYPRLRAVDAFPVEHQGQQLICIRDPLHLTDKALFVPLPLFFIISLFDGRHTLLDIQEAYMRMFGELLFTHQIEEIIQQLDEHYFLDNERFQVLRQQVEQAFLEAPVREAAHAGLTYPAERDALERELEGFFSAREGPGAGPLLPDGARVCGVMAPHIDLRRGGPCSAWAYKALVEAAKADLFLVFGTGHALSRGLFALTRKDFVTPLGVVQTDRAFVEKLAAKYPGDLFQDEFSHKQEHSIEFQLLFLQYLFRQRPLRIVPILCGSFQEMILKRVSPQTVPEVADFIAAVKETVAEQGEAVCYVAGVDLAHVGQKFGDQIRLTTGLLESIERKDRAMLRYIQALDAEGFFAFVQEEQDSRRICGLSSIYTMLSVMEAREGRLLRYEQAVERETQSTVTYASLAFCV
ncbi:MAG: AmmeMemoRadiSam system protein B [Nitrospinota bacterium]|nr:MAG: AmmeMemoRadiSam system protein B [Nitrospinota bacterium]